MNKLKIVLLVSGCGRCGRGVISTAYLHMYVWVAAGGRFFFIIDLTVSDLRAICIRNVSAQPLIRIHIRIRIAIAFPIPGY